MGRKTKPSISSEAKIEVTECWKDAIEFTNKLEIHSLLNNDRLYQSFVEIMSDYHTRTDTDSTTVHGLVRALFSAHPDFLRAYHTLCATRLFSVPNALNPIRVDGTKTRNYVVIQEPKAKTLEKRPRDDTDTINQPKPKSVEKRPKHDIILTRVSRAKITPPIAFPKSKFKVNFNRIRVNLSNCEEERRQKDVQQKEENRKNDKEPQKKKAADDIEIPIKLPKLRKGNKWRPEPCTPSYRFLEKPYAPSKAVDDSDPVSVLNTTCAIAIREVYSIPPKRSDKEIKFFMWEDTLYHGDLKLHKNPMIKDIYDDIIQRFTLELYEKMIRSPRTAMLNRFYRPCLKDSWTT